MKLQHAIISAQRLKSDILRSLPAALSADEAASLLRGLRILLFFNALYNYALVYKKAPKLSTISAQANDILIEYLDRAENWRFLRFAIYGGDDVHDDKYDKRDVAADIRYLSEDWDDVDERKYDACD